MARGIFHNLVSCENNYSDLLCNLVANRPPVASAFAKLLGEQDGLNPDGFETRTVSEYGNPDILYEDDKRRFLVEVKTRENTGLTDSQPKSYLDLLAESKAGGQRKTLFFLLPMNYPHRKEITRLFGEWRERTGNVTVGCRLVYWQDLYRWLSKPKPEDDVVRAFLAILRPQFAYEEVTMDEQDVNAATTRDLIARYRNIRRIVDGARVELKRAGFNVCPDSPTGEDESYGHFVADSAGVSLLWFGIWESLWNEKGFALVIAAKQQGYDPRCFDKMPAGMTFKDCDSEYRFVPFKPTPGMGDVVDAYKNLILSVLQAAGVLGAR